MFTVKNIRKEFIVDFWKDPFVALEDLSFELEKGKITGFLGANGAGKTTFLKILLRFIQPSSGEISYLDGVSTNDFFKNLGYMPERPYYYEYLTGREFLRYCGKLQNLKSDKIDKAIDFWTHELKVNFALDRNLKSYSKGMLQRIGFASALLHDPSLVVLDEPLSGLDPMGRKEFKDILLKVNQEFGCTVFFSSHIVSDVEEVSENVVVIDKGSLVYQGNINSLLDQSASKLVKIEVDRVSDELQKAEHQIIEKMTIGSRNYLYCYKENQEKLIKEMANSSINIISLNQESYSLEEVVYKLNG
ncbi:MAG: ABC transporter [Halobacteriovorax sp.]|nr:ABC transporter [Halobacteriovorax sp.]|tara:strand:+ start:1472 stop:2380 length:909 start_codon:yes stop_codon:yes gene_type:complete